jgi:hypothetical protein
MSQQMKQEPVELLYNDDDDIHSIADSEFTEDTCVTSRNGGGIVSMGKLKSKIRVLEVGGIKDSVSDDKGGN